MPVGPFRGSPLFSLSVALLVFLLYILVTSNPSNSIPLLSLNGGGGEIGSDAPSLAARLAKSTELWEESVNQRHELFDQYGPEPVAWPSGSPLPFYVLWNFFTPSFNCPWEMQRVGTYADGGKWVCGLSRIAQDKDCIMYSFGVSGESSFEAGVLDRTQCKVYGYDGEGHWGPEINGDAKLKRRSNFFNYALGPKDDHTAKVPIWTLKSLMKANGHTFISILKIDVEGQEFTVLEDLLKEFRDNGEVLPIGQLQIEIHAGGREVKWMVEWWEKLEEAGLRAFMTEPNLVFANMARKEAPPALAEYAFINVLGKHRLIS